MTADARFEFVEGAPGDVAFVASGPTVESVFGEAARAFLAVTVEAPAAVARRERRDVELEEPDLELLLVRFLNELVYLRDAEELLLHPGQLSIEQDGSARLRVRLEGEHIDRGRHALLSDVKAATAHGLRVARTASGWMASATLDV